MKVLVVVLCAFLSFGSASEKYSPKKSFCSPSQPVILNTQIKDEFFINIGDVEQWVSIRTENCKSPILLVVHGGPGTPSSYYTNDFFKKLEENFIVVHWDQRGTGKTLGKNMASIPFDDYLVSKKLSIKQLVNDGVELTEYLIKRFNKQKIILRGGSWGAYLAVNIAKVKPDLFYAYVGHSQLVNAKEKHKYGYQKSIELAESNKDIETVSTLMELGMPPYDHPRKYGQIYLIVKRFENKSAIPSSRVSTIVEGYESEKTRENRSLGDDYSWMHFVGFERLGIKGMQNNVDLVKLGFEFKIPIYIFQGAKDLTTPPNLTKSYFDKVIAPVKEYILIPDSAHEPNDAMLDKELALLINKILPITK